MRWFKRLLAQWVTDGWRYDEENDFDDGTVPNSPTRKVRRNRIPTSDHFHEDKFKNPLNITLYNAMGGKIIKFYSYDQQIDKSHETTYIIPSEMDFEKELGKCIAMESLKHTR